MLSYSFFLTFKLTNAQIFAKIQRDYRFWTTLPNFEFLMKNCKMPMSDLYSALSKYLECKFLCKSNEFLLL